MTDHAPASLVGDGDLVPCIDGTDRPYVNLDAAASTPALPAVAEAVTTFLPGYSSVHRGAGYRSRSSTTAYEAARGSAMAFAGRDPDGGDVAIFCRNTTEAINHLAYRLGLASDDVVVTTVVEHHANLLPFARLCQRRHVDCGPDGTFTTDEVLAALDDGPRPRLLAITGASNVTGWSPDLDAIIPAAHERGVPVLVDAAQLAPHRPLPRDADYLAWSGHKMYAPFGTGVLIGPRATFTHGDPFLAGGGAVDLVDLDEVVWTEPPDREEAGSPNVVGAVALGAAIRELERVGWDAVTAHDDHIARHLHDGLRAIPGIQVLGPAQPSLPLATFTLEGVPHALLAARLSAEHGIGVRHGCFCAHPYLLRLLGLTTAEVTDYKDAVLAGDRRQIPGAVRASASIATTTDELDRFLAAVADIARHPEPPVAYEQDRSTGDYWPRTDTAGWTADDRHHSAPCGRG
jgi:selenocysteine lyase/cysteine desulfurase